VAFAGEFSGFVGNLVVLWVFDGFSCFLGYFGGNLVAFVDFGSNLAVFEVFSGISCCVGLV